MALAWSVILAECNDTMSYEYLHLAGGPVADGWQPQAVAGGQQEAQAGHLQATASHQHYLRLFVIQLDNFQ